MYCGFKQQGFKYVYQNRQMQLSSFICPFVGKFFLYIAQYLIVHWWHQSVKAYNLRLLIINEIFWNSDLPEDEIEGILEIPFIIVCLKIPYII